MLLAHHETSNASCRYQIQYDVSDSEGRAATSLILNITFVESAIITGSFFFIGQADSDSTAQDNALALYNTSSVVSAAFTATVASVFQLWLIGTTSAYVDQLTSGLGLESYSTQATNVARLALFSDVTQPEVQVLNSTVDQNLTAQLVDNSAAGVQTYAYNVTLQVTVLTATLLSSVFVNVLNSTSSTRHLLSSSPSLRSDQYEAQHSIITKASAQQAGLVAAAFTTAAGWPADRSSSIGMYSSSRHSRNSSIISSIDMYSSNSKTSSTVNGSGVHSHTKLYIDSPSIDNSSSLKQSMYSNSSSSMGQSVYISSSDSHSMKQGVYSSTQKRSVYGSSHSSSNSEQSVIAGSNSMTKHSMYISSSSPQSDNISSCLMQTGRSSRLEDSSEAVGSRRLQAITSSSAFPLASLLLFKMDLTLAAFEGTSGCSTDNIADLFYDGADVPEALSQLCGSSGDDLSLSQALLALANSSIPLFQVNDVLPLQGCYTHVSMAC